MMGIKERSFALLTHVSLEELVPQNHFYRYLERLLDLCLTISLWGISRHILEKELIDAAEEALHFATSTRNTFPNY